MAAPCALVVSCCSAVKVDDLMKEMMSKDALPAGEPITDGIVGYPWHLDNKYYTANIQLCTTAQKTIGNQEFADNLEAIVIACSDEKSSFESVKQWLPFIAQLNPEIQIIACDQFSKSKEISRDELAVWCLDNSFELVELQPPEDEEDEEDEFDVTGTKRIVSALHAHMWPNLEMKGDIFQRPKIDIIPDSEETNETVKAQESEQTSDLSTRTDESNRTETNVTDTSQNDRVASSENTDGDDSNMATGSEKPDGANGTADGVDKKKDDRQKETSQDKINSLIDEDMKLFEALGNEDPGGESFEELFSRMATMKAHASTLPEEDRKKYAEKVAIAFWRAMGGEEEEIDGLDDDSD